MRGEEKNLKDSERKPSTSYRTGTQEMSVSMSYNKTNKLITALYIVTDIMDTHEPLRLKLRTLGVETLSDIISFQRTELVKKIQGILSLLDIASTMNMITEMNKNILAGEFVKFKDSLLAPQDNPAWLEEFLREEEFLSDHPPLPSPLRDSEMKNSKAKGYTGIGVQKGSTLLKAIKDMSDRIPVQANGRNFNFLKGQRREEIKKAIKSQGESATIKDIKNKISIDMSLSEKTLQRELMSMIKDGVLYKTGEKRWTQYYLK